MCFNKFLLLFACLVLPTALLATHNRAGEITYRHLGGFQYEATIITYTKSDSPADRPELGISWGDGSLDTIPRVNGNGQGEIVTGLIKKNIYIGVHTYPGPAVYILSFEDPNRNGGVVNIPNSVNIPFFVSTTLIINPFLGINNSVQLLNPPIDEACPGQIFMHNAGAYDPDGDSLSYRITECRGENGLVIPGFNQPQASSSFSIDAITGDLVWNTPLAGGLGEYNVAFIIEEWRNGILIGSVTRDMQINVVPCSNIPPVIPDLQDLCVVAGAQIQFTVSANNPDNAPPQAITLSATGGPFQFPEPGTASFPAQTSSTGSVSQFFNWSTDCSHVRKNPYSFSFKAIDNGAPPLASYQSVNITVVAPAPEFLSVSSAAGGINLTWAQSICIEASGYKIYRRSGSFPFEPGPCETGVPAYTGYELVATLNGVNTLNWLDETAGLQPGNSYCYRIIAWFDDGAESYSSEEICIVMPEVVPVLTHVSIEATATSNGEVYLEWSKPDDLDTLAFPGPYRYAVERRVPGSAEYLEVAQLIGLNDTTYTHVGLDLNTLSQMQFYRIALLSGDGPALLAGRSAPASSVFLEANVSDNRVNLSWTAEVPWLNTTYRVYRKLPGSADYQLLETTTETTYLDTGLANGAEFCYYIEAIGEYSAPGYAIPFLNKSQERCLSPFDNEVPCPPTASATAVCDSLYNLVQWESVVENCPDDVIEIRLSYRPALADTFSFIASFDVSGVTQFIHQPGLSLAGCYRLTAVDSFMNVSDFVEVCVDNCPKYELPNTFSPNGDGTNDLFGPFPYAFIESIDFQVFNRWGSPLFETDKPEIEWDGNFGGNKLPDGVYYYICIVNEIRLEGIVSRKLNGTIQLFGNKSESGN